MSNFLFDDLDITQQFDVTDDSTDTTNIPVTDTTIESDTKPSTEEQSNKDTESFEIPDTPVEEDVEDKIKKTDDKYKPSKEEKVVKDEAETTPSNDNKGHDSSPITIFAKALHDEGVVSQFDEESFNKEEDKIKALFKLVEGEIINNVKAVEENYPERLKKALEAHRAGVPENEIFDVIEEEIQYSAIDEDTLKDREDWQKELIRRDLIARNFTEEEINEELEDAESVGKLLQKSQRALKNLTNMQAKALDEKIAKEKELAKKREEEAIESKNKLQTYVNGLEEIIPGNKLNKVAKDKIIDSMTKPVAKDKDGKPISSITQIRSKDPMKFDAIFHYLLVNGVFEGKWDSVMKTARKPVLKELEDSISQDTRFKEGNLKQTNSSNAKSSLDAMRSMFDV